MKIKGKKQNKKAPSSKTLLSGNKCQDKVKKVKKKPAIKSKNNPELLPKSIKSQKNPGDSLLLSKKQLYKLQKEWDNKLKAEGFKDIEYRNSNGEMSHYTKKRYYERNHKKLNPEDIKEHIEHKTIEWNEYRSYYYEGQFESFFDKFVWYCYYQLDLNYKQIIKLIHRIRQKHPAITKVFSIPGDPEISASLKRSRQLKAILFP